MQTQPSRIEKGLVLNRSTYRPWVNTYSYESVLRKTDFYVENGLVQGDFRVPNPVYFRKLVRTAPVGYTRTLFFQYGTLETNSTDGIMGGMYDSFSVPWTDAEIHAITSDRCLEKLFNKFNSGTNLVVDLIEGGQTLKMVKNVLNVRRTLVDFSRALLLKSPEGWRNFERSLHNRGLKPTGERRSVKHPIDYATGKWLEYRYGWSPFVNSAYSILEQFEKFTSNRYVTVKVRAQRVKSHSFRSYDSATKFTNIGGLVCSYRTEMGVIFLLPNQLGLHDFTSLNPLTIAWELLPYSFVVDWFVNVGKQLELMENYARYSHAFGGGYRTDSIYEVFNRTSMKSYKPFPGPTWNYSANQYNDGVLYEEAYHHSGENTRKEMRRTKLFALPRPSMNLRLNFDLGVKQLLDATALLNSALRR